MVSVYWALDLIAVAMDAVMSWFGAILAAIDGATEIMVAAFFMAMLISAFIIPLRGAGMSDRVRRTKNGKTETAEYKSTKKVG